MYNFLKMLCFFKLIYICITKFNIKYMSKRIAKSKRLKIWKEIKDRHAIFKAHNHCYFRNKVS